VHTTEGVAAEDCIQKPVLTRFPRHATLATNVYSVSASARSTRPGKALVPHLRPPRQRPSGLRRLFRRHLPGLRHAAWKPRRTGVRL